MKEKDLRSYLEKLEKYAPDEIKLVNRTVNSKFELSAVLAKLESQNRYPGVMFSHVNGFSMPVVSNLFSSRKRLALALGCEEKELNKVYRDREIIGLNPN